MATRYDFEIDQGSDTSIPLALKDADGRAIDLTGCTAAMQLRRSLACGDAADSLTTENGRITISGNSVILTFPHATTEDMEATRYVYDLEVTNTDDEITRVLEGYVTIRREVTR